MSRNSIGEFEFISLDGNPGVLQEQVDLIHRPGTDGALIRLRGKHPIPFQLVSRVDAEDVAHGRELLGKYRDLIGEPAVPMIWADAPIASEGAKVSVLNVSQLSLRSIATATGGLNPPSGAWLEAAWILLLVE